MHSAPPDWEEGGEGWLTSIIPARAELASGDLRMLYLAWQLCAQAGELDDDVVEPPVPPDLGMLTGPLCSLAAFLRIDDDLLAVAAGEAVAGSRTVGELLGAAQTRCTQRERLKAHDAAVTLLVDLRAVAERKNRRDVFGWRFERLREQHLRKPSLLERFG